MHFGENQLSPGSLGMSPLPTAPPTALQRGTVRASSGLSPRLALAMGSSPGFGPARRDSVPAGRGHAPLGLARAPAPAVLRLSLAAPVPLAGSFFNRHAVRGPKPPPTDRAPPVSGALSPPSPGSFSPFPHGTTPLWVAGSTRALGGGPPGFPPRSSCGAVLTVPHHGADRLAPTGLSPAPARPSRTLRLGTRLAAARRPRARGSVQPRPHVGRATTQSGRFGPRPRSLATTSGLALASLSSGY